MWELSSPGRGETLSQLASEPLDILVVGGGVTGAGVALDAALRGLRVGLVERDDFACGTSSRSSKMIHGGLRYLATGDVRVVRESLIERRSIQQRAAHLVRPLPMLLPVFGRGVPRERIRLGAGLWVYDLLGAWRAGVRHSWLDPGQALRRVPNLEPTGLVGGLSYADSQADDVRLVMSILRTAVHHGARIVNGAEVVQLLEHEGRVVGASVRSDVAAKPVELEARVVVNCTGVWSDRLYEGAGQEPGFTLLPSKGIHLTVHRDRVGIESGVAFFSQTENSNVFVEPWQEDLALVGTSDTAYVGDLADPRATEEEIAALLDQVNVFLREPLRREDVISAWAGLRPLVVAKNTLGVTKTKDVSRRHRTVETPGLVSLVGGKLTTYRAMAQDAVDAAVLQLDRPVPGSTTHKVPLEGSALVASTAAIDELTGALGVERAVARHLLRRYGSQCEFIERLCHERPELRERLHPDRPYIAAEAVYACRYELARDAEDIIMRRTRIGIETRSEGEAARPAVEQLVREELARPPGG